MTMTEFSSIATHYDRMTGFSRRLVGDFGIIKHLVERFTVKTALDAGCGSGVHTIILSKIGVDVVGLDSSPDMLELARVNALREGQAPSLVREYFETMPADWSGRFDVVFCLANSLVGVETPERLRLSLQSFARVLKPGGQAVIQLLNFEMFRRTGRRIIKVSSEENLTFVRFLDFDQQETRLNIIIIEHELGQVKHEFYSSRILPVAAEMLSVAAAAAGFSRAEYFCDLGLNGPYDSAGENLVAVLTR